MTLRIGSCCHSPHVEARGKLCRVSSFCLYEGFRDGTHCQASMARILSTKPSHQPCLLFLNSGRKIYSYSLKNPLRSKTNKQIKTPHKSRLMPLILQLPKSNAKLPTRNTGLELTSVKLLSELRPLCLPLILLWVLPPGWWLPLIICSQQKW